MNIYAFNNDGCYKYNNNNYYCQMFQKFNSKYDAILYVLDKIKKKHSIKDNIEITNIKNQLMKNICIGNEIYDESYIYFDPILS